MNRISTFILLLSIGLIFSSCEDNFELTERKTTLSDPIEIEDPTELESVIISGRVMDSYGQPIQTAEILVYQENTETTLTTDTNGYYEVEI